MSEIKKPDIYKMNLPADLKKLSTAQCEELCGAYNGYPQSF